jgi:hypothetical protein
MSYVPPRKRKWTKGTKVQAEIAFISAHGNVVLKGTARQGQKAAAIELPISAFEPIDVITDDDDEDEQQDAAAITLARAEVIETALAWRKLSIAARTVDHESLAFDKVSIALESAVDNLIKAMLPPTPLETLLALVRQQVACCEGHRYTMPDSLEWRAAIAEVEKGTT